MRILGAFQQSVAPAWPRPHASASRASGSLRHWSSPASPPWAESRQKQQLRHLGRHRADRLYDWLIETDLGLKGSSQLPPRTLLERLVIAWQARFE